MDIGCHAGIFEDAEVLESKVGLGKEMMEERFEGVPERRGRRRRFISGVEMWGKNRFVPRRRIGDGGGADRR